MLKHLLSTSLIFITLIILAVTAQKITLGASSSWEFTFPLQKAVANLAVVSEGEWIYVIGGGLTPSIPGDTPPPIRNVYYTRILANGNLGGWFPTASLPDPLTGHAAVITNSTIYVVGGNRSEQDSQGNTLLSRDTMYTTIQADGTLAPWKRANYRLPLGISLHSAVVNGEYIYVMGGFDSESNSALKSVYRARILEQGGIGKWESLLDLPQPIYRHAAVTYGEKIYVIGGRGSQDNALNSVWIGQLDAKGNITDWISANPLPQGLYFHGAVLSVNERKIYTFGGFDGENPTDKVFSALINADGRLEPWQEVERLRLPQSLFRHSAVLAENGSVYLIGGKNGELHLSDTFFIPPLAIAHLNDPSGPVHEGEVISYAVSYANTSFITQTIIITNPLSFGLTVVSDTISPPATLQESTLVWNIGDIPPGKSGQVFFQARVGLLPSLHQTSLVGHLARIQPFCEIRS